MGGSPRVVVSPGQDLPDLGWAGELAQLTDAWPCLGPTWLAAAGNVMPELRPWHTVASRARGEFALAAGYIVDSPSSAGHDPRTYLGDEIGGQLFPALLLGSPLGCRSEIAYNFWTPTLMAAVISAVVPAAFQAGMRCILAPWIPARRGNQALIDALAAHGGHSTFWGYEHFIRLDSAARLTATAGVQVERADGEDIRPHLPRIAELAGQEPSRVASLLAALLDSGADLRAYLGRQEGTVMASCVTIRKHHRLFCTLPGRDPAEAGGCLAAVLDAPVRDARTAGLRTVEFGARTSGPGARDAVLPPGTQRRTLTTSIILADSALRRPGAAQLDAFGRSRHDTVCDRAER
jgi:hypothetical protein